MRSKSSLIVISILLQFFVGFSQDQIVPSKLESKTIVEFSEWLNNSTELRFYLSPALSDLQIVFPNRNATILEVLNATSNKYKLQLYYNENGFYYLGTNRINTSLPKNLFELKNTNSNQGKVASKVISTRKARPNKTIILGNEKKGLTERIITIKGNLNDESNKEPVFGATILINETGKGTSSDPNGEFELKVPKGTYTLSIRSLEKEPLDVKIKAFSSDKISLELKSKLIGLKEVVISAENNSQLNRSEMGIEMLSLQQIKKLPSMMGVPDIVKAALLLPGIQSVAEGSGQLNVRGAPSDQNIFYLDGIPVYNTNHLMGFFSAFTPNAMNDLNIYKASIPSRFGGRLSSVFDIESTNGSNESFGLKGGISPITTDIKLDGPIIKKKLSYSAAIRSTYSSWFLDQVDVPQLNESDASFQDIVFKLHSHLNDKNNLSTTLYHSKDFVKLNSLTKYQYQNFGASFNWTHYFNSRISMVSSASIGNYHFKEENVQIATQEYQSNNSIKHSEIKSVLNYNPNINHSVNLGFNSVLYNLDLGAIKAFGNISSLKSIDMGTEKALESGFFIEDDWKVGPRLTIKSGVRLNTYSYLGPNKSYIYSNPENRKVNEIIDTLLHKNNESIYSSFNPDLRLSLKYSVSDQISLKAAVNRTHQYLNVLSNNVTISPGARWKLADNNIKPMEGWQYSAGIFKTFKHNFEASIEGYYKNILNQIDYREGADLLFSPLPETEILQGDLRAYGVELMLRKNSGKITGWLNYTYARSLIQVNLINQGIRYPANFDKPHTANLSLNYQHSTRFGISTNISYSSGRPVTYPSSVFYQSDFPLIYYSKRNEFRIPYYFRCDIGATLEGNLKANKKFHGSWSVGIYNLFGRDNPFTVYAVPEDGDINGYQLSIFGSPIPSITYQLKLGNYAR